MRVGDPILGAQSISQELDLEDEESTPIGYISQASDSTDNVNSLVSPEMNASSKSSDVSLININCWLIVELCSFLTE